MTIQESDASDEPSPNSDVTIVVIHFKFFSVYCGVSMICAKNWENMSKFVKLEFNILLAAVCCDNEVT